MPGLFNPEFVVPENRFASIPRAIARAATPAPTQQAAQPPSHIPAQPVTAVSAPIRAPTAAANGGSTALHVAAANGNVDVVTELVQNGADVAERRSDDGWTSLHVAAHGDSTLEYAAKARRVLTPTVNEDPRAQCLVTHDADDVEGRSERRSESPNEGVASGTCSGNEGAGAGCGSTSGSKRHRTERQRSPRAAALAAYAATDLRAAPTTAHVDGAHVDGSDHLAPPPAAIMLAIKCPRFNVGPNGVPEDDELPDDTVVRAVVNFVDGPALIIDAMAEELPFPVTTRSVVPSCSASDDEVHMAVLSLAREFATLYWRVGFPVSWAETVAALFRYGARPTPSCSTRRLTLDDGVLIARAIALMRHIRREQ